MKLNEKDEEEELTEELSAVGKMFLSIMIVAFFIAVIMLAYDFIITLIY